MPVVRDDDPTGGEIPAEKLTRDDVNANGVLQEAWDAVQVVLLCWTQFVEGFVRGHQDGVDNTWDRV